MAEAWRFHNWTYSLNPVEITTVANQSDYSLDAVDGAIIALWPELTAGLLRRYTLKEYLEWFRSVDATGADLGEIFGYMDVGRDSDDKLQVRLLRTPTTAGVKILGFTKKRLTEYVQGDIATNTGLEFFPRETHGLLLRGAVSDIRELQGKHQLQQIENAKFKHGLKVLVGQDQNEPDKRITIPLPAMYRRRKRGRGGTGVA